MKNKSAHLRHEVINECLSSRRGYTITQLVEACNERYRNTPGLENVMVNRRQVQYDIAEMRKRLEIDQIDNLKDGRRRLYAYRDGTPGINKERLTDKDYGDFNQAIWLLESLVGLPYVKSAIDTLKKKIKPDEGGEGPVFAVETNQYLMNFDKLGSYFHYIRRKEPVKITYMASYEYEREFWFQPYFLKQYNSRWFLFGWNYDFEHKDGTKGILQNIAVDRVKGVVCNKSSFSLHHAYRPNNTDFGHYFDDIIGVTHPRGGRVEHIVMKIHDKSDWHRLQSKPIHGTQKLNPDDSTMTLDVMPNPELYSTLSQFDGLEIVSPERVRNEYVAKISRILEIHR